MVDLISSVDVEIFIDEGNYSPKKSSSFTITRKNCMCQRTNILKLLLHGGLSYISSMTKVIHSGERQNKKQTMKPFDRKKCFSSKFPVSFKSLYIMYYISTLHNN